MFEFLEIFAFKVNNIGMNVMFHLLMMRKTCCFFIFVNI